MDYSLSLSLSLSKICRQFWFSLEINHEWWSKRNALWGVRAHLELQLTWAFTQQWNMKTIQTRFWSPHLVAKAFKSSDQTKPRRNHAIDDSYNDSYIFWSPQHCTSRYNLDFSLCLAINSPETCLGDMMLLFVKFFRVIYLSVTFFIYWLSWPFYKVCMLLYIS